MNYAPLNDDQLDQYIAGGATTVSDRNDAIAERAHRQAIQIRKQVDLLVSEQPKLKQSVDRLHHIDIAILIVGTIAAVAGVILLFLKH
jgi:hypothetical protein